MVPTGEFSCGNLHPHPSRGRFKHDTYVRAWWRLESQRTMDNPHFAGASILGEDDIG